MLFAKKNTWALALAAVLVLLHCAACTNTVASSDAPQATPESSARYTVTFETYGIASVAPQTVQSGETAARPQNPEKDGYTFIGWYADEACTKEFDFATKITANTTIYAKWAELYVVSFETNGGTRVASQTVQKGGTAAKPENPQKTGYTFKGWYTDTELTQEFDFARTVSESVMLSAKWQVNTYAVTLKSNGETYRDTLTATYGETLPTLEIVPTSDIQNFLGFYTEADGSGTMYIDPNGNGCEPWHEIKDTTLYALWGKAYTVTFQTNGGTAVEAQKVGKGRTARKPEEPTRASTPAAKYTFAGWYTDSDLTAAFDFATAITNNATLYAKWDETVIKYTVTFYDGRNTVSTQQVIGGQKIEKPADLVKEDSVSFDGITYTYTFIGWYTTFRDDGKTYLQKFNFENTPVTKNISLYSKWSSKSFYNLTITDGITNGTVTSDKTSRIAAGETVTLTITPATENHELGSLTVINSSSKEKIAVNGNSFVMPSYHVVIDAEFKWKGPYWGTKAPGSEKKVGDIVFQDGSIIPYEDYADGLILTPEQKSYARAVIFYVGTECSNDEKTRTLGVGLKCDSRYWCSMYANAASVDITTIQCGTNSNRGSISIDAEGDKNGSDNFEQIATFLTSNGYTDDTSSEERYPAFHWAKNYGRWFDKPYKTGWYLPSLAELFQILKHKDIVNAAIEVCGGDCFGKGQGHLPYLSSSQYASQRQNDFCGALWFDNNATIDNYWEYCYINKASSSWYVCAIYEF